MRELFFVMVGFMLGIGTVLVFVTLSLIGLSWTEANPPPGHGKIGRPE